MDWNKYAIMQRFETACKTRGYQIEVHVSDTFLLARSTNNEIYVYLSFFGGKTEILGNLNVINLSLDQTKGDQALKDLQIKFNNFKRDLEVFKKEVLGNDYIG